MNNKHLIWWIFMWLDEFKPSVLAAMLRDLDGEFGNGATSTVNRELNAAFERYTASLEKEG